MSIASLSVKRPTFISCLVILIMCVGYLSFKKLSVDLFPNITFPVITVNIPYPGAAPKEVETLIAQVAEEDLGTVPGMKALRTRSSEGLCTVIAEFTLETDVKYAEQQIRDRVQSMRRKLPTDVKDPIVRRIDPADQPIVIVGVTAKLPPAKLFDLADDVIKTKIEQVNNVGFVDLLGGRKREIHVELDRDKLKSHEVSATMVSNRIAASGQNVPAGKLDTTPQQETVFRTLGEFGSVGEIGSTIVNFFGNEVPVTVKELGRVIDTYADLKSQTFVDGKESMFLMVFRQSGANTIAVADNVKARVAKLNEELKNAEGNPSLMVVRDSSKMIRANVDDVEESIFIGILLTIIVVFVFLGSIRSTIITGLAIPNSLLGAFILISAAGFTINVMSLLALSLAVGLLVDDAIVVRENIYRHVEMGKNSIDAALEGTKEVTLAVIATTLTVIAVFGPIGFLKGVVGQFFKEFGLTICFAMAISLFDAMTVAPMLSAYFAGVKEEHNKKGIYYYTLGFLVRGFNKIQLGLDWIYEKVLRFSLRFPLIVIAGAIALFFASLVAAKSIPKTFLPAQDFGEFGVSLDLPPGTSLREMSALSMKVDELLHKVPEVETTVLTVGNRDGEANVSEFFVKLVEGKKRSKNTTMVKDLIRDQLKPYAYANPKVKDIDSVGGGARPFTVNLIGSDLLELEKYGKEAFEKLKGNIALKDVDISYRPGKPEFQVALDRERAERLGISSNLVGLEIRNMVEGVVPAVFRQDGREYDIRVRLKEDQRDFEKGFNKVFIPNINQTLIKLNQVAKPIKTIGPANILRQDKGRYVQISADVSPQGPGLGKAIDDVNQLFTKEMKLPAGMRFQFIGQAENFKELSESMLMAAFLGIMFIYLVLASLYESFVTPFSIMLVLPLAACGAFFGLALTGKSLDLFSMIGCVMLLGIATKNSILLVDYANQQITEKGIDRTTAMLEAGRTRLRPILMTSFALIAGMLPIAIGLNEASKQRTSMGVAVIGGLVSSTVLTLLVVPAAYSYIDRFRVWSSKLMKKIFIPH